MSPIKIFFCYAREDEALLEKLKAHLRPLQRQKLIDVWHDRDIAAGSEWEAEIKKYLNTAQIILLLISPDFMNSDYCYSVEMEQAMDRHEHGDAHVIPIILRPIYWQGAPFGKLQALPTDAKSVTSASWHNQDEAFFDVAEGVRKRIISLHIQQANSLGTAYSSNEKYEKALAVYEEALLIASDDITLCHGKGIALYDLKRYSEALEVFNKIISLDPKNSKAFNNKGIILSNLSRRIEGLVALEQAIILDPQNIEIYLNKYKLLEKINRYSDALITFEQAFEIDQRIDIPRLLYVKWAKKLLTWSDLVFLEIDTTGLQEDDEIIRILLVTKNREVLFDTFICADKDVSSKISNITGISNEMVYDAPIIKDVWADVMLAIQSKHVISFNLDFDQEMLEKTAERYELEMPNFNGECLMKRAMMYSRSFSYSKLSSLCSYIGQPLPECPYQTALHRAYGQIAVLNAISQNIDLEDPYLADELDIKAYLYESAKLAENQETDSRYTKFTKQAMNAIYLAQEEAQLLQGKSVDAEHLLLGLIREREGIAVKILANLGVELDRVYNIIKNSLTNDRNNFSETVFISSSVKKVLELAIIESTNMKHFYAGTEYILLGLVYEEKDSTINILKNQNISFDLVKAEISKIYS